MGDSLKNKEKGQYNQWGPEETKVLIDLLVDAVQRNWRDSNGLITKLTVEQKILPALNEKLGCHKTHKHYLSRMKYLRTIYTNYVDLQRFNSGFGWDRETKKFTALDEVWDEYLKKHPNHKHLRYDSVEQFEDLQLIFGCGVATGSFSMGMSDNTNSRTLRVGENNRSEKNTEVHHSIDEAYESSTQQPSQEYDTSSFLDTHPKGGAEKLPPRKRSKTEVTKDDQDDSMVMVSNKILSIIQQREERQQREAEKREEKLKQDAEEREAEKKKDNIWDAMKEIPNLDNHTRYKAITLIHSLGMKNVFTDMSIEERFGWIKSNISST
ncbi:unnamed protein product [Cochlearia groenlandica]